MGVKEILLWINHNIISDGYLHIRMMSISVVTVVKFHTTADEIQYNFLSQEASSNDFFDILEELVIESHSNLGIILLNKIFQELTKLKRILTKVVLLM